MRTGKLKTGLISAMRAAMLWLCLALPAMAGPFEDGLAAYERKDYATALRLWRPLAEQGLAEAQFNLGLMYDTGEGVPQDYAQAHLWYNLAAAALADGDYRKRAVEDRHLVAAIITPAQIAEAQRLAREWAQRSRVGDSYD